MNNGKGEDVLWEVRKCVGIAQLADHAMNGREQTILLVAMQGSVDSDNVVEPIAGRLARNHGLQELHAMSVSPEQAAHHCFARCPGTGENDEARIRLLQQRLGQICTPERPLLMLLKWTYSAFSLIVFSENARRARRWSSSDWVRDTKALISGDETLAPGGERSIFRHLPPI
jgi:hypothetical protein